MVLNVDALRIQLAAETAARQAAEARLRAAQEELAEELTLRKKAEAQRDVAVRALQQLIEETQ